MIQIRIKQQKFISDINHNIPKKIAYINDWNEEHVVDVEYIRGYDHTKLLFTKLRLGKMIRPNSFHYANEKIIIKVTVNNNTIKK